ASFGVVLAAVYLLWMFRRVMYGPVTHPENRGLPDLTSREALTLLPIIVGIFWIGLYPNSILRRSEASVRQLLVQVESKQAPVLSADEARGSWRAPGSARPRSGAARPRPAPVTPAGAPAN